MTTAADIIKSALRKIGVADPGETLASEDMNTGIEALNDMLAMWSAESMNIYATTQENFPLTGAQSYTIGSTGDFNTQRPIEILQAFTRIGSTDYPCSIITKEEYNELSTKSTSGSYPYYLAYAKEYPLGRIYVYPASTGTLYIESQKLLQQFTLSTTDYSMPPEQLFAIKTNLAAVIAPEYGKLPDANLMNQAMTSKSLLKSLYARVPRAKFDIRGRGYDVLSDTYI